MRKIYLVHSSETLDDIEQIREMIINLFVESSKYISQTIDNTNSQKQFIKTCKRIQETFYYEFKGDTPFRRSYSRLVLLERSIKYSREIDSNFWDFINPKQKYDLLAFEIIFDILEKFETRFIKGGYGKN